MPDAQQSTPAPLALEARGVTRSLPLGGETVQILRGIDLRIARGAFVALVGPSGSGKSTLLGVIAGLDRPSGGRVLVDGLDITDFPESRLAAVRNAKIGMVFQAFNLIPTLTAQENVEVPLYVGNHRGSPAARAGEMLELVGLGHRLGHRPAQLSGGEQQRVAIARALVTRPAIVIADEPTGNLDHATGARILELIAQLRADTATTFLIATHDRDIATTAEEVHTIVDGVLVSEARPSPTAEPAAEPAQPTGATS
ncbi:MAG TPA: ABC transporter ATP-binding protein [Candidatus Dormibacteraeota bacterium]|nr:ABC transporter ATP-binding protein [Candidatus Dormibacteraeota bacterium]